MSRLITRARQLRRAQTPFEAKLWSMLRARQAHGLKWRRQHPIDGRIADFACVAAKLVVELDGLYHLDTQAADAARTARLEAAGWTVLRFGNHRVVEELEGVVETILAACAQGPHPDPLPEGEGGRALPSPRPSPRGRGGDGDTRSLWERAGPAEREGEGP